MLVVVHVMRRPKYSVREERTGYTVLMWLLIKKFTEKDVGSYKCVSTNSLGRADGTLRLYGEFARAFTARPEHYVFRFVMQLSNVVILTFRNLFFFFSEIKIGFDRTSRGKDHVSIIGGK